MFFISTKLYIPSLPLLERSGAPSAPKLTFLPAPESDNILEHNFQGCKCYMKYNHHTPSLHPSVLMCLSWGLFQVPNTCFVHMSLCFAAFLHVFFILSKMRAWIFLRIEVVRVRGFLLWFCFSFFFSCRGGENGMRTFYLLMWLFW